jgi:DNA adenine methylase
MDLNLFPDTRYMGSKRKLLPSLQNIFNELDFSSALDAFSGSSSVSFLLKSLDKKVITNDYLRFNYHIAHGLIENPGFTLSQNDIEELLEFSKEADNFIEKTFSNIYYTKKECQWLDSIMFNINFLDNEYKKSIALSALCRACIKKRPRGIYTYTGMRYDDGRKDLTLSFQDQFQSAVNMFNSCVTKSKKKCKAFNEDIFKLAKQNVDLVYFDPPYFSTKSDSEYSRRYHFLEGLVSYWSHVNIDHSTKTKKFERPFSKFNHKNLIIEAFEEMFEQYSSSIIMLSYSSNSFPNSNTIKSILKNHGKKVELIEVDYTYSVGTHSHKLNNETNKVKEYIFIGV